MGLRKILTYREPALHKTCKPVINFDTRLHKLLDDMRETLLDSGGVGLAAPQIGILRRVVLVDTGEEILELINPTLLETSGEQVGKKQAQRLCHAAPKRQPVAEMVIDFWHRTGCRAQHRTYLCLVVRLTQKCA